MMGSSREALLTQAAAERNNFLGCCSFTATGNGDVMSGLPAVYLLRFSLMRISYGLCGLVGISPLEPRSPRHTQYMAVNDRPEPWYANILVFLIVVIITSSTGS
jgi:hypothetical protein